MKTIITFFLFTVLTLCVKAQDPTDCNCTPVTTPHSAFKELCTVSYQVLPDQTIYTVVGGWFRVEYEENTCGSVSTYKILMVQVHDLYDALIATPGVTIVGTTDCPNYVPLTAARYDQLIDELVPKSTGSTGRLLNYPSSCQSIVTVTWPQGASYTYTDDLGTHTHSLAGKSWFEVPCNDICCIMELTNDGTSIHRRPVKEAGTCDGAVRQPYVPTLAGYTGTIVAATPCEPMCSSDGANAGWGTNHWAPPYMSDGGQLTRKIELSLTAYPNYVHDLIHFTSDEPITEVAIYDAQGKKIAQTHLEKEQLNIGYLSSGIYYMQVHFEHGSVRTVKIFKQ